MKLKAALRVRVAVVAATTFESGIARCLTSFAAPEERLERQVNAHRDILPDLRMDTRQIFVFFCPRLDVLLLLETRQAQLALLPRFTALGQKPIVEDATRFQSGFQNRLLSLGGKQPDF